MTVAPSLLRPTSLTNVPLTSVSCGVASSGALEHAASIASRSGAAQTPLSLLGRVEELNDEFLGVVLFLM